VSKTIIHALNPISQRLMARMPPHERVEIMAWLSCPEPMARAVVSLMDELLMGDNDMTQVALAIPAVAAMLEEEGYTPESSAAKFYAELQSFRDGVSGPAPKEIAAQRQHAGAVAAAAAATAATASLAPPPESKRSASKRASARLATRRKSCPLLTLDEDTLCAVLSELGPVEHGALLSTSHAWRAAVHALHGSARWRRAFGCLRSSDLLKVLTESGMARLDIIEGCQPHSPTQSAESSGWTRLCVHRLDGPSIGYISQHHIIGIFTHDRLFRLDIGGGLNPQLPACESNGTRLRLCPVSEAGASSDSAGASSDIAGASSDSAGASSDSAGASSSEVPLHYGQLFGLFSLCGTHRLSLGPLSCHRSVHGFTDSWATRLQLTVIKPPEDGTTQPSHHRA